MGFWEFLTTIESGSLFMLVILGMSLCAVGYKAIMRICRCININKSGWPPRHCDADGDPIEED